MPVTSPNTIVTGDGQQLSHFCPEPFNFNANRTFRNATTPATNAITTLTDRRRDTSEPAGKYVLQMLANRCTHLYIVGQNIISIKVEGKPTGNPVGGPPFTVTNAEYAVAKENGENTPYKIGDYSHYLIELNRSSSLPGWTATTIEVTISGSSAKVYEIAALNSLLTFDANAKYLRMDIQRREIATQTYTDIYGGQWKAQIADAVNRRTLNASYQFRNTDKATNQDAWDVFNFLENNLNFAFIFDYTWHPDLVFTKAFSDSELRLVRRGLIRQNYELPMQIVEA